MASPIVTTAFGTATKALKTYDQAGAAVRKRFPSHDVRWPYTSHMLNDRVQRRHNLNFPNLGEVLSALTTCMFILFLGFFLPSGSAAAGVFVDEAGRKVIVPKEPRRIVSLAPSVTEILFALGLEGRVVGVTEFSNYPPGAAHKSKVGSFVRLNAERILDLKPDLAVGTVDGNPLELVRLLEDAGVAVYAVNPQSVEGMIRTVAVLGTVCGVEEKGDALARHLQARLARVADRIGESKRPRVFLQINTRPIMSVNSDTLHHDVIRLAGGDNVTADFTVPYPRVSLEEVLSRKPDVILISSMERGGAFEEARQAWFRWPSISAVRTGRVHLIDSDLIDRPSPRVIQGLEAMADLLHPGDVRPNLRDVVE